MKMSIWHNVSNYKWHPDLNQCIHNLRAPINISTVSIRKHIIFPKKILLSKKHALDKGK